MIDPPSIRDSVLPDNVFEPDLSLVLVLVYDGSIKVTLSWTLYNSPFTPIHYEVYRRRVGYNQRFVLYQTIDEETYVDTVDYSTVYEYYVVPIYLYPNGQIIAGDQSNVEYVTTNAPALAAANTIWTISRASKTFVPANKVYLSAIDVSDKTNPVILSETDVTAYIPLEIIAGGTAEWVRIRLVFVDEDYVYLFTPTTSGVSPLFTIWSNVPAAPVLLYSTVSPVTIAVFSVIRYSSTLFILLGTNLDLVTVDVSSPMSPVISSVQASGMSNNGAIMNGSTPACITADGRLSCMQDPNGMWQTLLSLGSVWSHYSIPRGSEENVTACPMIAVGNYIYRSGQFNDGRGTCLQVIDTIAHTEIVPVGGRIVLTTSGEIIGSRFFLKGKYLLYFQEVSLVSSVSSVYIFDVSDPTTPVLVKTYNFSADFGIGVSCINAAYTFDTKYAYCFFDNDPATASYGRGAAVFDLSNLPVITLVGVSALDAVNLTTNPIFSAAGCYPNGDTEGRNDQI
jgi:hypothetical protein